MTEERKARLEFEGHRHRAPVCRTNLGFPGIDIGEPPRRGRPADARLRLCQHRRNPQRCLVRRRWCRQAPVPGLPHRATRRAIVVPRGRLPALPRRAAVGRRSWTSYRHEVTMHTLLNEEMKRALRRLPAARPPDGDPVFGDQRHVDVLPRVPGSHRSARGRAAALRLIAKIPTVAAFAYKKSIGQPYRYPRNDLTYAANFLHMMFSLPVEEYGSTRCWPRRSTCSDPPRRPRPELLDVDGSARRVEPGQPVHLGGRRDERAVGSAAWRSQPAR
jgi:hypothetical protein